MWNNFSTPSKFVPFGLTDKQTEALKIFYLKQPRICYLHIESAYFLKMKTLRNDVEEINKNNRALA